LDVVVDELEGPVVGFAVNVESSDVCASDVVAGSEVLEVGNAVVVGKTVVAVGGAGRGGDGGSGRGTTGN
jgi:hypothetical protein